MFIIFGLKSIIKQLLDLVFGFSHLKCIIEQLLDSVFVICKIISVSVRVIILAFGSANNSYLDTFSSPEPFSLLAVTRGKIGSGIND